MISRGRRILLQHQRNRLFGVPSTGTAAHLTAAGSQLQICSSSLFPSRGFAWTPASLAFPRRTAAELYAEILDLTKEGGDFTVHNYGNSFATFIAFLALL